jgi:hypothetical protein
MSNVLLIWELCPEESRVYYFEDLPKAIFEKLRICHGHLGNTDVDDTDTLISDWLCGWLEGQDAHRISSLGEDVNPQVLAFANIYVIHTGFQL